MARDRPMDSGEIKLSRWRIAAIVIAVITVPKGFGVFFTAISGDPFRLWPGYWSWFWLLFWLLIGFGGDVLEVAGGAVVARWLWIEHRWAISLFRGFLLLYACKTAVLLYFVAAFGLEAPVPAWVPLALGVAVAVPVLGATAAVWRWIAGGPERTRHAGSGRLPA